MKRTLYGVYVLKTIKRHRLHLRPYDRNRLSNLCGSCDENIKYIESQHNVTISRRENIFSMQGNHNNVTAAVDQIKRLYALTAEKNIINLKDLHMEKQFNTKKHSKPTMNSIIELPNKKIKLYNQVQKDYYSKVLDNTINFAIGPSGTGKTFLAVAFAAQALLANEVDRIILARPAVDAGEKLGFLPGDLAQKVDPYLRPFYDALYDLIGVEQTLQLIEKGKIEVAPLAYMRGRTLSEAFIILDESQNTSMEQMKMLLTRLGHDSKIVITGDLTQIDLPRNQRSGLSHAKEILAEVENISFTHFDKEHVVRHDLIQKIIEAYEGEKK